MYMRVRGRMFRQPGLIPGPSSGPSPVHSDASHYGGMREIPKYFFFPSPSRGFKLLPQNPIPNPRRPHSSPLLFKSPLLSSLLAATAYLPPPQEASRRFREAAAERLQVSSPLCLPLQSPSGRDLTPRCRAHRRSPPSRSQLLARLLGRPAAGSGSLLLIFLFMPNAGAMVRV